MTHAPIATDVQSQNLLKMAERVAKTDATVLISGESGTGKEVLAHFIHDHSARSQGPFIAINCAAIPEAMLESILFGYEKGAFTGAYKSSPGKFEQAQDGTLLLDEISEMDLVLQAKLLRVLQEKEVERIGSEKTIQLNVRIIATTNRDMKKEVFENRFREDLYYRLNVFPLYWIPLRDRRDDIIPMAHYLIQKHYKPETLGYPELSAGAAMKLKQHTWPGNAREMDNVIQRALILRSQLMIEAEDIMLESDMRQAVLIHDSLNSLKNDLVVLENEKIVAALVETRGNRKEAAKKLSISERTLRYKLSKIKDLIAID